MLSLEGKSSTGVGRRILCGHILGKLGDVWEAKESSRLISLRRQALSEMEILFDTRGRLGTSEEWAEGWTVSWR